MRKVGPRIGVGKREGRKRREKAGWLLKMAFTRKASARRRMAKRMGGKVKKARKPGCVHLD